MLKINKVNSDRSISMHSDSPDYIGENIANRLKFLIPSTLNDFDILHCTVSMTILNKLGGGNTYTLTPETELYAEHLVYLFDITNLFTTIETDFTYFLTITSSDGKIMKTGNGRFSIEPKPTTSSVLPEAQLDKVDSLEIRVLALESKDGTATSDKVSYTNGTITNVQEALDKLLYVPVSITLSSPTSLTQEKGAVLNNLTLNWTYSKSITSQKLNDNSLNVDLRTYVESSPVSRNKTYTLAVNDGVNDFTKSISFNFIDGIYYGVANESIYDSVFINSLTRNLQSTKNTTFTVNCDTNQYIYYACPVSYGDCSFMVGGFEGGISKVLTFDFTNSSGYTESYQLYKSNNSSLGNTTVNVI